MIDHLHNYFCMTSLCHRRQCWSGLRQALPAVQQVLEILSLLVYSICRKSRLQQLIGSILSVADDIFVNVKNMQLLKCPKLASLQICIAYIVKTDVKSLMLFKGVDNSTITGSSEQWL